jgi:hypothetical protein
MHFPKRTLPPAHLNAQWRASSARSQGRRRRRYAVETLDCGARRALLLLGGQGG